MPSLHWQLAAVQGEIRDNQRRAHELAASVTDEQWVTRPEPTRWSAAECLSHLNLSSAAMLASMNEAIAGAPKGKQPRRYRRDPIGWMLCWTMEPPVRKQFPTSAPFLPERVDSKEATLAAFDAQHAAQGAALELAAGRQLGRAKMQSPFNSKIRYNAYSAFRLLTAHERRHLWQAEQAVTVPTANAPSVASP